MQQATIGKVGLVSFVKNQRKKGGRKMIRNKKRIETAIVGLRERLNKTIDEGLNFEKENNEAIACLKKKLKELHLEVPYENTLRGKIEDIESKTLQAVALHLKELSEITGNEYSVTEDDL